MNPVSADSFQGIEGAGLAPRQPLPGTREAWPQRVGWLSHLRVAQASPADASETPLRAPPEPADEALTVARQIRRPVVHEPVPELEQVRAPTSGLDLVSDLVGR